MLISVIKGLLSLAVLYAVCLALVIGVKTLKLTLKTTFATPPEKPPQEKPKTPRKRKPVKSISIDPAEVDRIYVKKVS